MILRNFCIGFMQFLGRGICIALAVTCLLGGLATSPVWAGIVVTDTVATPKNTERITTAITESWTYGKTGLFLLDSRGGAFLNEGDISFDVPTGYRKLSGITNGTSTSLTNTGDITLRVRRAVGESDVDSGIFSGIHSKGELVNRGKISVSADLRGASVSAYLDRIYGISCLSAVENSGNIILDAHGAIVSGSRAGGGIGIIAGIMGDGIVSKGNNIQINFDSGSAIAEWMAGTHGPNIWGLLSSSYVKNYSNIVINTSEGFAQASRVMSTDYTVRGISANGDVTSYAPITITATAGRAIESGVVKDSKATVYGIEMQGSGMLASTAPISVFAQSYSGVQLDTAKQVYVSGGTTTITDYAMVFDGSVADMNSVYSGTVALKTGASANFSSATLHAYMGKNFQAGTYDIPMLVEGTASAPSDQFVTVKDYIRDFSAKLTSGGGTGLQKIVFTYEPKASVPALAVRAAGEVQATTQSIVSSNLTSLLFVDAKPSVTAGIEGDPSTMVASSDPSVLPYITKTSDKNNSVFVRPVVVRSSDSSSYGYDAKTAGLTLGYTRQLNDDLFLGTHAGYTNSSVDYTGTGVDKRSTDIDTYYLGLHSLYRYTPNWIFTVISSFYLSDNDYRDDAAMQQEDANYKSYAIRTEVTGGYLFAWGKNNFYPEVGLTHSWQHCESYTTNSDVTYETKYGTMDDHELYLSGKLKWFRNFKIGNGWTATPLIGVGVTQALLDGEIGNSMSVGSSSQLVVDEGNDTTITPEFNLTLSQEDLSLILGYNGGYSNDLQNSMFWFQASLDF